MRYLRGLSGLAGVWALVVMCLLMAVMTPVMAEDQAGAASATVPAAGAGRPELALRIGHTAEVTCIAVARDGKIIATGSKDRTIKLWNPQNGDLIQTLIGHQDGILSVAFWPKQDLAASGSRDGTIRVWDAASGALLNTVISPHTAPLAVAFSPDGKTVASSFPDHSILLWNAETGETQETLTGSLKPVRALAFSGSGAILASGSEDGKVKLWDTQDGSLQRTLPAHALPVNSLTFSPRGSILACGSEDGGVSLWNTETGKLQQRVTINPAGDRVSSVAFSSDGALMATGGFDDRQVWKTVKLWNPETGQELGSLPGQQGGANQQGVVNVVAFLPESKTLVAGGSRDNTINIWDAASGMPKGTLGSGARISSVAFAPDGALVASGSGNSTVKLWSAATGELKYLLAGHTAKVNTVVFSPDSKMVASGSQDGTVRLWDAGSGLAKRTFVVESGPVNAAAFSPDGSLLACGIGSRSPGEIRIWNLRTGAILQKLTGDQQGVNAVAFSPDGKLLASGSGYWGGGEVRLWDSQTGEMKMREYCRAVHAVAFSPDGKVMASGSAVLDGAGNPTAGEVRLWNAQTGALQRTLEQPGENAWINSLAFSQDGKTLAGGSQDGAIYLWNRKSGELVRTMSGHLGGVTSVSFAPHGLLLASGSQDNTLKLWDGERGAVLVSLVSLPPQEKGTLPLDWMAILPEGYYDGSVGAGRFIQWRVGRDLFPVEAYEQKLHRPDLVRKALAAEPVVEEGIAKQFVAGQAIPPEVFFTSPGRQDTLDGDMANVELTVTDPGKVTGVEVLVNGRPSGAKPLFLGAKPLFLGAKPLFLGAKPLFLGAKPIPTGHRNSHQFKVQVPLPPGEGPVVLTAVAADEQGLQGREELRLRRRGTPTHAGSLYVLAVGVSHYQNPRFNLNYAASDAAAFANLWKEASSTMYSNVHTVILADDRATVAGIQQALAQLSAATEEDSVALFLSGHGIQVDQGTVDEQGFYFATHEIDPSTPATVAQTALPWTALRSALAQVKARRVFLFLDACHSGNALGGEEAHNERLAESLVRRAGVLVFASSRGSEYSYEVESAMHGAFTAALLEGVGEGKADFTVAGQRDHLVTAEELLTYLRSRVPQLTENRQTPTCPLLLDFGDSYPLAPAK